MLKIPKSVEYAFLALKYVAESDNHVSVKEIATKVNIPYELLAKIMQKLVKHGIIASVQGTKGGYTLSENAEEIKLSRVIAALDQNVQMTDCMVDNPTSENCKRVETCCLVDPVKKIQIQINSLFDSLTLAKIL